MCKGSWAQPVKPLILAIETSAANLGVSVVSGDEVVWEKREPLPQRHSEKLLPMCLSALAELGLEVKGLSAIAVSAGPGSFTGLRIGFATAQGLALGGGIGIVQVPTFEALLRQGGGVPRLAVVQGKAKAQTVTALYARGGEPARPAGESFAEAYGYWEALPASARGMDEFAAAVREKTSGQVHVTGDAAAQFVESFSGSGRNGEARLELTLVPEEARFPSPSVVGLIASRMYMEGKAVRPGEAVPLYYRRSQAEVKALLNTAADIRIEKMTLQDLDRVLEIEAQSYKTPWSRRAFTSEITENSYAHYYVARADGKIVGYVGMWVILDEAHITNIAVDPAFRRKRIGQRMLESMFEKAKSLGATRMTLEVRVSNTGAQTLYKKLGFADRGLRKGYYTDTNEDAIIMWKDDLGPQKPKEDQVKWMV
ncbi:MAG: ribosomal protein S18-alanine N-acetyltransferase [Bacillota bacterium]